ncbi:hypothetical protein CHS0354_013292 [Potamilus streckersoni]|uniref:Uncharacterized protein n=1 Tax=Potamilus streckersoni TaxID=2493646 RepID=A0AAE0SZA3_9BIVA|nr:hypothetical protein CHS0354_013292 [Potamilus streckersoni]
MIPFSSFTPRMWAAVVLTGLGVLFGIISLASTSWNDLSTSTIGLWKICTVSRSTCIDSSIILTDAMKVGRALVLLGFLAWLVILILLFVYFFKLDLRMILGAMITGIVCASLMVLGAILWTTGIHEFLSWGYYLCYLSAILAAALAGDLFQIRKQLLTVGNIATTSSSTTTTVHTQHVVVG